MDELTKIVDETLGRRRCRRGDDEWSPVGAAGQRGDDEGPPGLEYREGRAGAPGHPRERRLVA
jgi:hypothetical protein